MDKNGLFTPPVQAEYTNTHTSPATMAKTLSNRLRLKVHQLQKTTKIYLKNMFSITQCQNNTIISCSKIIIARCHLNTLGLKENLSFQHKAMQWGFDQLKPNNLSSRREILLRVALRFAVEGKAWHNVSAVFPDACYIATTVQCCNRAQNSNKKTTRTNSGK